MATQNDGRKKPGSRTKKVFTVGTVILVVALVLNVGYRLVWAGQNNQVLTPPGVQQPALIKELPDLTDQMSKAKTLCEDRARAAQGKEVPKEVTAAELEKGRKRYVEAKAAFDGCITDMKVSLIRLAHDKDLPRIKEKLERANESMMVFLAWYDKLFTPTVGAHGPLATLLDFFENMAKYDRQENQKALAKLHAELEKCRLAPWHSLAKK